MSNQFFKNFPIVDYDGQSLRNIILKSRIIKDILVKNDLFHPLVVEDGERPDTIAYDYYGDSELYWVVLLSNDMIDPYFDWPMTQAEFRSYIIKKYGNIQASMSEIIHWKNADKDYIMMPETKRLLSGDDLMGWNIPVYAYDYENELNEQRRNIKLLDKNLVPQVLQEIEKIYG